MCLWFAASTPLTEYERGKIKITGSTAAGRYPEDPGFPAGMTVETVSSIGGNVIVSIGDSRIAVNEDMARHIYI